MKAQDEFAGFQLRLLTESDESGEGELWLVCPDGRHFAVPYVSGPTFALGPRDADQPWLANCQFAHSMATAAGRRTNFEELVKALRARWLAGDSRK